MHPWIVDGEAVHFKACDARAAWVGAQDIKLFINSPGGSVTAGMGIYDAMMVSGCFGRASALITLGNAVQLPAGRSQPLMRMGSLCFAAQSGNCPQLLAFRPPVFS